jgi:hypothetical protein
MRAALKRTAASEGTPSPTGTIGPYRSWTASRHCLDETYRETVDSQGYVDEHRGDDGEPGRPLPRPGRVEQALEPCVGCDSLGGRSVGDRPPDGISDGHWPGVVRYRGSMGPLVVGTPDISIWSRDPHCYPVAIVPAGAPALSKPLATRP